MFILFLLIGIERHRRKDIQHVRVKSRRDELGESNCLEASSFFVKSKPKKDAKIRRPRAVYKESHRSNRLPTHLKPTGHNEYHLISVILFACLVGAALLGRRVHRYLPEDHLSADSRDAVKLAMGLVATMTALVLGLLVSSAKGGYDTNEVK